MFFLITGRASDVKMSFYEFFFQTFEKSKT